MVGWELARRSYVRAIVIVTTTIVVASATLALLDQPETPSDEVLGFRITAQQQDEIETDEGLQIPTFGVGAVVTTLEEETSLIEEAAAEAATTTTVPTTQPTSPPTTASSSPGTTTTAPPTTTTTPPTVQSGYVPAAESDFAGRINAYRSSQGLAGLTLDSSLNSYARSWAKTLAGRGGLAHSNIGSLIPPWNAVGENVGRGGSVRPIFDALVASSSHRENMLDDYTHFGIGVYRDANGTLWTAHVFAR